MRVEAPRTCVTTLEIEAPNKTRAERIARDIVKFGDRPIDWGAAHPFTSLGIRTQVIA